MARFPDKMATIILMRHGRVKLTMPERIASAEFPKWVKAYDHAGVFPEAPEASHRALLESAGVVCSGLTRSVVSAQVCGITPLGRESIFNEAKIPWKRIPLVRLRPKTWTGLFRFFWFLGFQNHAESLTHARHRAKVGSAYLDKLAKEKGSVTLIGHGVMNRLLAWELRRLGWKEVQKPGPEHWAYGVYEYKGKNNGKTIPLPEGDGPGVH